MNLKRIIYEISGSLSWLILLTIVLVIAVLIKDSVITNSKLVENKELIDVLSKIVTMVVLLTAGILSYIKFFGVHTLRPKLILKLQSGLIPVEKKLLHWIEVEVENTGSNSIWNYGIKIYAIYHGEPVAKEEITKFVSAPSALKITEQFVDVGESAFEHALVFVPPHIRAVTFQAVLVDENGAFWTRCLTVKNSQ
jgi:hypothetical protein